jgi:hypothetical protein
MGRPPCQYARPEGIALDNAKGQILDAIKSAPALTRNFLHIGVPLPPHPEARLASQNQLKSLDLLGFLESPHQASCAYKLFFPLLGRTTRLTPKAVKAMPATVTTETGSSNNIHAISAVHG